MKRSIIFLFMLAGIIPATRTLAAGPYIRIDFRLSHGVPWVDVEMAGSTYRFVLDTGAGFTVLGSGVADAVKPGWDKRGRRNDPSLRIRIRNMTVGGRLLPVVKAAVVDQDNFALRCLGADGILGMDILQRYTLVFDYGNNAISLYDKKIDEVGLSWLGMGLGGGGCPFFYGKLGDGGGREEETLLFFDSGNGRDAVIFTERPAKIFLPLLDSLEHSTGLSGINIDGKGDYRPVYRGVIPELGFGDAGFRNLPVREGRGYVGYPYLSVRITVFGRLILDFPRRRYAFIPYEGNAASWSLARQRVYTMVQNGRIVVGAVWEETLRGVVNHGDIVEKVGNTAFGDQDECTHKGIAHLVKQYATPENYTVSVRKADGTLHILPAELFLDY